MSILKVTFDTNTLSAVVMPERHTGDADYESCLAIQAALKSGRIKGFFSESVITLDALSKVDKVDQVSSTRIASTTQATGPLSVTIAVGPRWAPKPISPQFRQLLEGAFTLEMRLLMGPRYLGGFPSVQGFGREFFVPYSSAVELIARGEKANQVDSELARKGLGRARAVNLGLTFSQRDGRQGEFWPAGLERARDNSERKKVSAAINEWADGDAIAAHVSHGNDLFCTHDRAKGSGQQSVLHPTHRRWLTKTFGVHFVTRTELAEKLGSQ